MSVALTLHLGAHRTGSSSLQRAFASNRGKLGRMGVAFWGPGILRKLLGNAVLRAAVEGRDDDAAKAEFKEVGTRIVERLKKDADGGADALLISEENLLGTMAANLWQARLYPHVAIRLATFSRLLPNMPQAIYLTVRDYAAYWASSYGFAALRNDLPDFDDLRPGLLASERGWTKVVDDIQTALPGIPLLVRPYKADPAALPALVTRIVGKDRVQGLSMPLTPNNRGLSEAALAHALASKRAHPKRDPQRLIAEARQAHGEDGARYMPFTSEEQTLLSDRYTADLAALAERPGVTMLELTE